MVCTCQYAFSKGDGVLYLYIRRLLNIKRTMKEDLPQSKNLQMKYNVSIRRQARQKIMRDHRNSEMFESRPMEEIVKIWALPADIDKYTVHFIISHRYQQLLQIPASNKRKYQEEDNQECAMRELDDHLVFWSFFLQEVFLNREKFTPTMIAFLEDLVQKYKYKDLVVCRPLQCKVINVIELSIRTAYSTKDYRDVMLHWVTGPEGINIIYECIFSTFLPCQEYPTVYEVIKNTLAMKRKSETAIVCLILNEMLRTADADDIFDIYQKFPDVGLKLMEEGVRYVEQTDISDIAEALMLLVDSFVQVKEDYVRGGLGYLVTRMLISRNEPNIVKGLEMLSWITECESKEIIEYLVNDREVCDAGLWKDLIDSGEFLVHRNLKIKKNAIAFLHNVLLAGQYEHLVFITSNFNAHYAHNFLHFLQICLRDEADPAILNQLLSMLLVLLFYGEQHRSEDDKNLPLEMCVHMNMAREVERTGGSQNEQVRDKANEVLRVLQGSQHKQQSLFD